MRATFRGEEVHKVDAKGRVSILAGFRPVIEAGDPSWEPGSAPKLVIVYGDHRRNYLECFTVDAINEVDQQIQALQRGSKQRIAAQRLYNGQAMQVSVDETGRLVLPKKLRDKIGLTNAAYFIAFGDTFRIYEPDTFHAERETMLEADDDFDPDEDPSAYLGGIGG